MTASQFLEKKKILQRADFSQLIEAIRTKGYTLIGPVLTETAISFGEIHEETDLPIGWMDIQEPAKFQLKRREDEALFGYNVGFQSIKKYLFPPRQRLFSVEKKQGALFFIPEETPKEKYAFLGVRSCDLHAVFVQDKIFCKGSSYDPLYAKRRQEALIIVVQCGQASGCCFCRSMGTGPKAQEGFDLALTECIDRENHFFLVEIGSQRGEEIATLLPLREVTEEDLRLAQSHIQNALNQMRKKVNTESIKDLFYNNWEHPRWDDVAERCIGCSTCTMVCPTCFCWTVEDSSFVEGLKAERWRRWDFCYTMEFSHLPTGSVRSTLKSRYRQWLSHKFGSWIDQFGTSGCVGCGRCITWCPVGIDVTEELAALREKPDL
ncbi:4Fe-4S dicluster domain-containing protein [Methylacidiphilum caldifontis]|uniref:Sulfite reductase subunit A n=1 Tax=Methylacidiphilum caldifontis TaxID=2795386 RepID=A0A4Y8PCL1_9BACT|nr:4Fe-4S dicluster domain-containing protein [Methylacidiphilum caldifontis]QSR87959.1 4Fe-4S dicluster domain-containing protein [Methylacidiphilum caldifontis]TFE68720.1 sulfite reductase subunit A [Methylacidiphilum caldifontis]